MEDVMFAAPELVEKRRRRRRILKIKQVAIQEVSATPKVVMTQKIEAVPLAGHQPQLGVGKTWGIRSNKPWGKQPSRSQTFSRLKHSGEYLQGFHKPALRTSSQSRCPFLEELPRRPKIIVLKVKGKAQEGTVSARQPPRPRWRGMGGVHIRQSEKSSYVASVTFPSVRQTPTHARIGRVTTRWGGPITRYMTWNTTDGRNYHQ